MYFSERSSILKENGFDNKKFVDENSINSNDKTEKLIYAPVKINPENIHRNRNNPSAL